MDKLQKVLNFAIKKHKGQVDKSNVDYINHPMYLALQCKTQEEKVVALLHDILEDTDATMQDLMDLELTQRECEAIKALTHTKDITYVDYVKNIKKNPLATKIKLLDLQHNLSDRGIELPDSLTKRYHNAIKILKGE